MAFAKTILRVSTEQNLAALRTTFGEITLTSSAQYLAIALVRHGDAGDVIRLIERIGGAEHRIPYWFQIEVGRAVGRRMRSLRSSVPTELLRIYENNEFWRDPRATSLANRRSKLPLKNIYNRALYVRIVANALIGSAGKTNSTCCRLSRSTNTVWWPGLLQSGSRSLEMRAWRCSSHPLLRQSSTRVRRILAWRFGTRRSRDSD